MEYAQIMCRIQELNCGDNYKLVGFILEHSIEVLEVTPATITCNTLFGDGTRQPEVINASMPDVRAYLGY